MFQITMVLKYGTLVKICDSLVACRNYLADIKADGFTVLSYEIIQGEAQ